MIVALHRISVSEVLAFLQNRLCDIVDVHQPGKQPSNVAWSNFQQLFFWADWLFLILADHISRKAQLNQFPGADLIYSI